jgi:hypothetical protein
MLGRSTRTPDDRSVTPQMRVGATRPTQLLQKAHSCDRHHIASAMAELVSCLSIIPHMRSFDVPPKLSPAHAGLFFRRSTQKGARDRHCVRPAAARGARSLRRAARVAAPSRACPSGAGYGSIANAAAGSSGRARAVRRSSPGPLGRRSSVKPN